jgi:hypothetical protein
MVKLPTGPSADNAARPREKDDQEQSVPKAPKASTAMGVGRAIVIAAVLLSITYGTVSLLTDRYALVPPTQSENAFIYRIDRLTGKVAFCTQNSCTSIATRAQSD